MTINLGSSDAEQGQFPTNLNFNSGNWNQPQTVTVKGLNDGETQSSEYQITGVASSSDGNYDARTITPITVLNQAVNTAGINVNHTSINTSGEGGVATFTVDLTACPADPVTINLVSSDPAHGTVAPSSLLFDASDWNTAQTVTVIAQNTQGASGNIFYTIAGTATSSDANYNALTMPTVTVDNKQNTQAGFVVEPGSDKISTSQSGGQGTFTVALSSASRGLGHHCLEHRSPDGGLTLPNVPDLHARQLECAAGRGCDRTERQQHLWRRRREL